MGGYSLLRHAAAVVAFAALFNAGIGRADTPIPLALGIPKQPSAALMMIARAQGFFEDHGIAVDAQSYPSGKRALLEGLFQDKVEMVSSTDVPIAVNALRRSDFRIVATVFEADNVNRVIARRDSGIEQPTDLIGKRVATQKGSAVHFFLFLFGLENNFTAKDYTPVFMKAENLPDALAKGDIDAFSMREPYIGQAKDLLGANANVFESPGTYLQGEHVVVSQRLAEESPKAIEAVMRALLDAEEFASAHPAEAQKIVADGLGQNVEDIKAIWPTFELRVNLRQFLVTQLEDILAWVIEEGIATGETPNVLHLFHPEALRVVAPSRMTVIY